MARHPNIPPPPAGRAHPVPRGLTVVNVSRERPDGTRIDAREALEIHRPRYGATLRHCATTARWHVLAYDARAGKP